MLVDELGVRSCAMAYLTTVMAASGGVVNRAQLEAFTYGSEQIKLIDQSRGIRNPANWRQRCPSSVSPRHPTTTSRTRTGCSATPTGKAIPTAATTCAISPA